MLAKYTKQSNIMAQQILIIIIISSDYMVEAFITAAKMHMSIAQIKHTTH
jgi:hypothetical protein